MVDAHERLREIDISKEARALMFIQVMNYVLVLFFSWYLLRVLGSIFAPGEDDFVIKLIVVIVMFAPFIFLVYTAWRDLGGTIDSRNWRRYIYLLPPVLVLCLLGIARNLLGLLSDTPVHSNIMIAIMIVDILIMSVFFIILTAALVAALRLRASRIASLNISLRDLLCELSDTVDRKKRSAIRATKVNAPLGALLGAIGIIMISSAVTNTVLWAWTPFSSIAVNTVILPTGLFLLLMARRYWQVHADSLLSVDKRKPILFLRSFDDDEKQHFYDSQITIFDFSLETRLVNHFKEFGPFIAIGSPAETVPVPGAARVKLSDSDWQARVLSWISEAAIIVMYGGKTQWVNWELARVIDSGRIENLILMMPEIKIRREILPFHRFAQKTAGLQRSEDIGLRIDRIKDVLKNTTWSRTFAAIQGFHHVYAMSFREDGVMTLIRSRVGGRQASHLAAVVAHYSVTFPFGGQKAPDLSNT